MNVTLGIPTNPSVFEHEKTGQWLCDTWEDYIRPKYKRALDKWNKDTGGGDGNPVQFINFCSGDCWLAWLFCIDYETNFVLASSAGGRMPEHLQVEAGFSEDLSAMTPSDSNGGSAAKRSIDDLTDEVSHLKKSPAEIESVVSKLGTYLDRQHEKGRGVNAYIKQVADY
jgi:hypothetical protein